MADFDYVPINTTAEKIEKISNMDVLTETVETENDNALVSATALLKTLVGNVDLSNYYIKLWQPNTEYKVGDIVLGTVLCEGKIDIPVQALLKCNQDHISSNVSESITDYNVYKRWDLLKKLTTEVSVKAIMDDNANIITNTYATKEELAEAIGEALEGDY